MHWTPILAGGLALSAALSAILFATWKINPRLLLRTYPADVKAAVAPWTAAERRQRTLPGLLFVALLLGVPYVVILAAREQSGGQIGFVAAFLHAFAVHSIVNLVDLLLIDWLLFCTITPRFVVLPGTEGMAGYKDYAMHARHFLRGTLLSALVSLVLAAVAAT